jgi:hypothetical protein
MSTSSAIAPPIPGVSDDVLRFLEAKALIAHLRPIVEMTRGIFVDKAPELRLADDPEIEDDRYVVLEVDTASLTVEEAVAAQRRWSRGLFGVCPASQAQCFRLLMV